MKICFLTHQISSGGAERTVSYLSNDFVIRKDTEVDLVQFRNKPYFYDIDNRVKSFNLTKDGQTNNIFKRFSFALHRMVAFRQYCKNNKPDVIVCMMHVTKVAALLKPKNIPIILSERYDPATPRSFKYKIIRKWFYNTSEGAIFQTERAMDYYKKFILKDKKKGIVIPNAIGNSYVYDINAMLVDKENKISAVGRLAEQKNYKGLIDAFLIVLEKYFDYKLEIFGEGDQQKVLEEYISYKNLNDKVILKGADKTAIKQISSSKCYVLASHSEGMPNTLMEAMAIGLPCVSTDCPNGPAELIKEGENGLLVPIKDSKALANAILKMLDDKEFAYNCAKNARKLLETNNIEVIADKFYNYIFAIAKK